MDLKFKSLVNTTYHALSHAFSTSKSPVHSFSVPIIFYGYYNKMPVTYKDY